MYGLKVLRIAQDFKVIAPHERRAPFQGMQRLRTTLANTLLRIRCVVIANLMASMRQQIGMASAQERQTALLCAMSRELAETRSISSMARAAVRHVAESFRCQAVILLPGAAGKLGYPRDCALERSFRSADLGVAQWVADHGRLAGFGTDTFTAAPALYIPLGDPQERPGVLALLPTDARGVLIPGQRDLIQTFATQIGLAMDRARLAESAEAASLAAERESLRNTLLASISHDLRTPLAVIAAAGSTLVEHGRSLSENTRTMLARSIETKAREMSKLVSHVLDLTRFESGQLVLRRDWQSFDDLAGTAVRSLEDRLEAHLVELCIPPELPFIFVDGALIVQVLYNLLENASKYTPAGTRVCVSAVTDGECLRMSVDDDGPGLPPGDPARLFDKFQRGNAEGNGMGAGLGLAISRAIIVAHGGYIEAQRRERGGAKFDFTVPLEEFAS